MVKTNKITFTYLEFDNHDGLSSDDKELVNMAREAAYNAYAPYSGFSVGAAVRLESGIVVKGTNVENAAFTSGICAERNALSNSVSNHPDDTPVAIAIAAMTGEDLTEDPVPPCGSCRQVISEEELRHKKKIRVILSGKSKVQVIESCSHLLPLQFTNINLNVNLH
jgi:cytidine deaminase